MAGNARKMVEKESGKKVVSRKNSLKNRETIKELPPE
jgi:hypothetical protein